MLSYVFSCKEQRPIGDDNRNTEVLTSRCTSVVSAICFQCGLVCPCSRVCYRAPAYCCAWKYDYVHLAEWELHLRLTSLASALELIMFRLFAGPTLKLFSPDQASMCETYYSNAP